MSETARVTSDKRSPGPDARRRTVLRSLLLRGLAVVVLIVFVLGIGDYRRKRNGMDQAKRYAAILNERIGDSESLPLNLALEAPDGLPSSGISLDTLSRDEVRALRSHDDPVLIAWSVQLLQVLNRNGRAVVVFEKGQPSARWLTETEFRNFRAAQRVGSDASP